MEEIDSQKSSGMDAKTGHFKPVFVYYKKQILSN